MAGKLPGHSSLSQDEIIKSRKFSYGIAVAQWNEHITDRLLQSCLQTLHQNGIPAENIKLRKTPGSFELPLTAKCLLEFEQVNAVICLGCIIKGETDHDQYIAHAIAHGIMQLSLETGHPVIFGVLTVLSEEQALDRAGGKYGNKGEEAAISAIKMLCLQNV
ncbi:MAG: 6,7-dimethyl-8-ribityllumazine synthase [Saprospiraceae bacterium]|nr:6,7-dimethyl-8-ribityllumazine synthase [Saprospiraceae bacterium]